MYKSLPRHEVMVRCVTFSPHFAKYRFRFVQYHFAKYNKPFHKCYLKSPKNLPGDSNKNF